MFKKFICRHERRLIPLVLIVEPTSLQGSTWLVSGRVSRSGNYQWELWEAVGCSPTHPPALVGSQTPVDTQPPTTTQPNNIYIYIGYRAPNYVSEPVSKTNVHSTNHTDIQSINSEVSIRSTNQPVLTSTQLHIDITRQPTVLPTN